MDEQTLKAIRRASRKIACLVADRREYLSAADFAGVILRELERVSKKEEAGRSTAQAGH